MKYFSADPNLQSLDIEPQSTLVVTDPMAKILAYYPDTNLPAFAVKKQKDWTGVFVGADVLNRRTIHALAQFAGAWGLSTSGYGIAADDNLLMIHPLQSGPVTVFLPCPAALREVPPGTIHMECAAQHQLTLKAGATYLFRLEK